MGVAANRPAVRKINHTGISVSDMSRSLAFYVDLLGFEQVFESTVAANPDIDATVGMRDIRAHIVFLDAGETRLELWQYDDPVGRPLPDEHRAADVGVSHVAVEVNDVDALHARAVAAGYRATTKPVDLGIHKTFYLFGPDGEIVELLEDNGSTRDDMARIMERRRARANTETTTENGGASDG